jgi:hypothetical protein
MSGDDAKKVEEAKQVQEANVKVTEAAEKVNQNEAKKK